MTSSGELGPRYGDCGFMCGEFGWMCGEFGWNCGELGITRGDWGGGIGLAACCSGGWPLITLSCCWQWGGDE